MRRSPRRFALALLSALLIATPALAEISVKTTRIGHGVTAWYAPYDGVPVVDVVLSFEGAGSASDPAGKAGRANFAAAMVDEGAGALDAGSFARALEEKAITLDITPDADRLTIHIRCLREHAARAGELLALALTSPTLAEADMARVRQQMASTLAQLQENPTYQASKLLADHAFRGHPYASPAYGTPESIATLNAQDVRDYLGTYITRGNLLVAAAGDVDSGLLSDMLRPTVEALKENDAGAVAITPVAMQGAGETVRQLSNVPQTIITFAAPAVPRNDKRFYTAYLLNQILGGNALTARLSDELRQKKGLVYHVGTELDVRRGGTLLSGQLATRNSTAETALAEVKALLADIRAKGVTTEECNDAKQFVLGHFPLQLDRSNNVSAMLLTMQIHKLGEDYMTDRITLFNDVSCGDINTLAGELLAPEKFLFAVVGGAGDANAPAPTPATALPHDAR